MYWRFKGSLLLLAAGFAMTIGGGRMAWSSFRPLDPYTQRMLGEQPMWGRALGLLVGPLVLLAGLFFMWDALGFLY